MKLTLFKQMTVQSLFGLVIGVMLMLALTQTGSTVSAAGVYAGGSYDGYDSVSRTLPAGWPSVNNAAGATNATDHSVCLNGSVLSTGSAPTTVYVYWGPTDGTTNITSWTNSANFGPCVEGQVLSTNVALSAGSAGYYRFYCTNDAGEYAWAASSSSYATLNPPMLSNLVPTVSFTTAILSGRLVAGDNSIITVYWGPDTNNWANTNTMGACAVGSLAKGISGLSSNAVYYCRWYGTNTFGAGWSDTIAFTTRPTYALYSGGSYDGYTSQAAVQSMAAALRRGTIFTVQ